MILIDKTKFTVDGVDVYPDHESPHQFWYIPGTIQLAERNNRKVLSYLWYNDATNDADGTGFLNFEVNSAIPPGSLDRIRSEIARRTGRDAAKISLSTVTYTKGAVNFSVLGPLAAKAAAAAGANDPSLLYQSPEQIVWSAGSSSLVGDNAAVCSVKFTKAGKLAAAMKAAILAGSHSIAALYRLEFLAMRPSVTFKVQGTLKKTIRDFQASIGTQLPLTAVVLDLGLNAQWQRIMQRTDLKIEVVNFSGESEQEGLKWAQKILLDYVIMNFFEVQVGPDAKNWSPMSKEPAVSEAIEKALATEEAATDQVEGAGLAGAAADAAIKELVKTAGTFIPKVNIRAAYYEGRQTNTIDFIYAEMKARTYPVLPQAQVLKGLSDPGSHVIQVNRAQDPFGLPYHVALALPSDADLKAFGLQALNIQARYPADAPRGKQSTCTLTITDGKRSGSGEPFPFQYDARGSADVAYTVDYVFKPGGDWSADATQYSISGREDRGLIVAMPDAVVEFIRLDIRLDTDFVWENADQAVVTLTSPKWKGEKRVVLQRGQTNAAKLNIRSDAKFRSEAILYKVELRKGSKTLSAYGPETLLDNQVVVHDRFVGHVPVYFTANFDADSVEITLSYAEGSFRWEDQFTLEKGQKRVQRIVPTLQDFPRKSDLQVNYEIFPDEGEPIRKTARGGQSVSVKLSTT